MIAGIVIVSPGKRYSVVDEQRDVDGVGHGHDLAALRVLDGGADDGGSALQARHLPGGLFTARIVGCCSAR